ncbi:MAG: hypothetical protein R6X22_10840 [Gemmatimonadota bacterium]|jgi:hypothetical protein
MFVRTIIACAILVPALAVVAGSEASHPDAARAAVTIEEIDTPMGCQVNVTAKNGGSSGDIWFWSEESRVRTRQGVVKFWGPWKKPLPMSNRRIRPGELAKMTMELDLGCDFARQYEFRLWKGTKTNAVTRCYGGDKGTTRRDIPLSDVDRLFSTSTNVGC